MADRDLKAIHNDLEDAVEAVSELLYLFGERDPNFKPGSDEPTPGGPLGVVLCHVLRELVRDLGKQL